MYEFLQRRKKLLNQYKELSKTLPKNFMNIHFKSFNIKNRDIKTNLFPEEIFMSNNNQQIMKDLDSETKSFILNKNKILNKYSTSLDIYNKNKEKKKKINFTNNQTIILTKFNNDNINENRNNINRTIDDIIFNKDLDKMCEKKRNKYINTFTNGIYQNNLNENKKENNFSKEIKIKRKTLSKSFYNELNRIKNRKNLELKTDEKESNKNINGYKEVNNNNNIIKDNNDKNCQTSFSSLKQKSLKNNSKENIKRLLKNEEKDNLKNNKEDNEINNKLKKDFNTNYKNIKEIKFKNGFYNTYNNKENKKREKLIENFEKINLEKDINDKKERLNKKEIELMTSSIFSNFTIRGNIINNHKGYNSSGKIKERFNKLNYLYINTDDLKNKENYLYGTNNKFIGKSLKNYQTKNNVFLPNLTKRMKEKPPRYERQFNGFILA